MTAVLDANPGLMLVNPAGRPIGPDIVLRRGDLPFHALAFSFGAIMRKKTLAPAHIASHRRSSFRSSFFLGSHARIVLAHSPISVLVHR